MVLVVLQLGYLQGYTLSFTKRIWFVYCFGMGHVDTKPKLLFAKTDWIGLSLGDLGITITNENSCMKITTMQWKTRVSNWFVVSFLWWHCDGRYLYGLLWWRFITLPLSRFEWRLRMFLALMLSAAVTGNDWKSPAVVKRGKMLNDWLTHPPKQGQPTPHWEIMFFS